MHNTLIIGQFCSEAKHIRVNKRNAPDQYNYTSGKF